MAVKPKGSPQVRSLKELLKFTGCDTVEELSEKLSQDPDPDMVADADDAGVGVHVDDQYSFGLYLPYPFARDELYYGVSKLWSLWLTRVHMENLPESEPDEEEPEDCTEALAEFFDIDLRAFRNDFGGGWTAADPLSVTGRWYGDGDGAERWFVAGTPRQVLLGVQPDHLSVATPQREWRDWEALDSAAVVVDVDFTLWWDVPSAALLQDLSAQVARVEAARTATFTLCPICRDLVEAEDLLLRICRWCLSDEENAAHFAGAWKQP